MIAGVGLPNAYDHFKKEESPGGPPFICFLYTDDNDFKADDTNYQRITGLTVELYTDEPDFTKEAAVEAALTGAGLVYARSGPEYIQSERMYQTTYETSVVLTEAEETEGDAPSENTEVLEPNAEQG